MPQLHGFVKVLNDQGINRKITEKKTTFCRAWGHSFARGFARLILDRVRDNLDQAPGSRN
jgi:hypothetical protein